MTDVLCSLFRKVLFSLFFVGYTELFKEQGRIVHRSGIENKIIYKKNKGEKGLIGI